MKAGDIFPSVSRVSCPYFFFFHLEEALYFKKGNKYPLLAIFNLLGRDHLLYNGLKLSYLELEESVKQWRNTKLLMKTSLIEKEPGKLEEGQENSCMSVIKGKKNTSAKPVYFLFLWQQHILDEAVCITYLEVKRNKAMLWSTDN